MENWKTGQNLAYPGTQISVTENGWMTSDAFYSWFEKFCEIITQRPLLLIYDGHSSHIQLKLILKARQEQISLLKLPPHTTDRLQPLDVCCFKPLKTKWDKKINEWSSMNHARRITKPEFIVLTGTYVAS